MDEGALFIYEPELVAHIAELIHPERTSHEHLIAGLSRYHVRLF